MFFKILIIKTDLSNNYFSVLTGEGLYYVVHYNAETGSIACWLGESIDTLTKVYSKAEVFEKDSTLYSIRVGTNRAWGATPITVNFLDVKYATSLEDALGTTDRAGSINASISGVKYGVSGNSIPNGTKVTLTREGYDSVKTTVRNGKLTVHTIPCGAWNINVDGYIETTIEVQLGKSYADAIELQYDLFANYLQTVGWNDCADLTKQNSGSIVQENGRSMFLVSNDTYNAYFTIFETSVEARVL